MRRGDIRTAVLAVLAEEPGHGYDVIQRLEEKTGGAWRPSPGGTPWDLAGRDDDRIGALRDAMRQLQLAAKQVGMSNNRDRLDRTVEILKQARREIYTMLAED